MSLFGFPGPIPITSGSLLRQHPEILYYLSHRNLRNYYGCTRKTIHRTRDWDVLRFSSTSEVDTNGVLPRAGENVVPTSHSSFGLGRPEGQTANDCVGRLKVVMYGRAFRGITNRGVCHCRDRCSPPLRHEDIPRVSSKRLRFVRPSTLTIFQPRTVKTHVKTDNPE